MQIGVIGLNHKQAPVELRETLAKVCARRFTIHPYVLLTTCNRTEIYFSSFDLADTQSYILSILKNDLPFDIGQELYSFFGIDCFYHLARVTSGFDSAILAETEIQGQVKNCYQQSHQLNTLPFELHYLFQKALKVGKEIRTRLILPRMDIEHAVMQFGERLQDPSILFVGASKTNMKIASYFKKKEYERITFTNRTDATASQLEGFDFLPWSEKGRWVEYDWVIVATKAEQYQITVDYSLPMKTKLLIDLSVPRNIDPQLSKQIPLINIDQVNSLLQKYSTLLEEKRMEIELLLEESARRYVDLFHDKSEKLYVFA